MWCNSGSREEPHETVVLITHTDEYTRKKLTANRLLQSVVVYCWRCRRTVLPTRRWRGKKWVTNYYLTTQVKNVNVKEREGGVVKTRDRRQDTRGSRGCLQIGPEEGPACKTERA